MRLCAPLRFLRSPVLCRLYEGPSDETINRGPPSVICMQKVTHTRTLSMPEFGGLWKHQNDPACTESVGVFIILMLDSTDTKEEEEEG